jgi:hypothetical protein
MKDGILRFSLRVKRIWSWLELEAQDAAGLQAVTIVWVASKFTE